MRITLLLLVAVAFLIAGCTLAVPPSEQLTLKSSAPEYNDPSNLVCQEVDAAFPCACMNCKMDLSWSAELANYLHNWFDGSLKGGSCNIENCNAETYYNKLNDKGDRIIQRTFMYGVGPSFVSSNNANLYCDYTLQLATKWMLPKGDGPPRVPHAGRALCWLDRNIIPLYIYYTKGEHIDPARTAEIAKAFDDASVDPLGLQKGAGPVMITTEVDLDSADDAAIALVRAQIAAIHNTCDKCKTVLAVKSNDKVALAKLLGPPGFHTAEYDMVDVVGFGFRANDYPSSYRCNVDKIINENFQFSRYILSQYQKPTIWLYAGASQGKNIDGECEFSAEAVHSFYQSIFKYTQGFASSGMLGISFYEFTDGSGPLPCTNDEGCGFGFVEASEDPANTQPIQKHPELNTWSSLCRYYGSLNEERSPLVFSRNSYGTSCDFASNTAMFRSVADEINTDKGLGYTEVVPTPKQEKLNCGEVCPSDSKMARPEIFDDTGSGFPEINCEKVPSIDELGDDLEFSPMYFRAIIEQESSFRQYAVSCIGSGSSACNKRNLPLSEICRLSGIDPADCPANPCSSGQKVCAYGMAQMIDYPGKFYDEHPEYASEERTEYTGECGGRSYNPFNVGDNTCAGLHHMRINLDKAENFVENNWGNLHACLPEGIEDNERGWATYYLATNMYYGSDAISNPEWNGFLKQRDVDSGGDCCLGGTAPDCEQNYIAYLRKRDPGTCGAAPNNEYAACIMSRFTELVTKCDTECVGK